MYILDKCIIEIGRDSECWSINICCHWRTAKATKKRRENAFTSDILLQRDWKLYVKPWENVWKSAKWEEEENTIELGKSGEHGKCKDLLPFGLLQMANG